MEGRTLEEVLGAGLTGLGIPFSEETLALFRRYYTLLEDKNRQMNLTAISGEAETARLHFLDCAAILPLLPSGPVALLDVGSGAGFPGLVLKLLRPELSVTLLDSQKKRVLFLQEVCDALSLKEVFKFHGLDSEYLGDLLHKFRNRRSKNFLCTFNILILEHSAVFIGFNGLSGFVRAIRALHICL